MGTSTPRVMHSTKVMAEHIAEMTGWSIENGTKVQTTKEKVRTRKDEEGPPQVGMDVVWLWF